MKDILGREVNPGDLVVVKGTGRYNCGLRVGLMKEKVVKFENMTTAEYGQYFKIMNPTPEELEIKENILKYEKEKEEHRLKLKEERRSKKAIPKKELEIGRIYVDDRGSKMYFLGKGITYRQKDKWDNKWSEVFDKEEGFIFIGINQFVKGCDETKINYRTCNCGLKVRKTIPRFVEKLDIKVDIDDILELVDSKEKPKYLSWYNYRDKIVIKLDIDK